MVVGQPKVYPNYGDIHGAWAPGDINGNQFLEVNLKIVNMALNVFLTFSTLKT